MIETCSRCGNPRGYRQFGSNPNSRENISPAECTNTTPYQQDSAAKRHFSKPPSNFRSHSNDQGSPGAHKQDWRSPPRYPKGFKTMCRKSKPCWDRNNFLLPVPPPIQADENSSSLIERTGSRLDHSHALIQLCQDEVFCDE